MLERDVRIGQYGDRASEGRPNSQYLQRVQEAGSTERRDFFTRAGDREVQTLWLLEQLDGGGRPRFARPARQIVPRPSYGPTSRNLQQPRSLEEVYPTGTMMWGLHHYGGLDRIFLEHSPTPREIGQGEVDAGFGRQEDVPKSPTPSPTYTPPGSPIQTPPGTPIQTPPSSPIQTPPASPVRHAGRRMRHSSSDESHDERAPDE